MGYHSSSDDYYSSSRSNKKHSKRSRRRSRSSSSERSRDHKRRKKDRRARKRSRSSSVSSRDEHRSRKSHKSHKKSHQMKKSSDAVFGKTTGTMKDVFDIEPGFSKMTPAEQAKIRVRRALESANKTKSNITEEQLLDKVIDKDKDADIKSQISRHQQISNIESNFSDAEEFVPSHFKSKSTSGKPVESKYNQRENTHELAIFGHTSVKINTDQLSQSRLEAVKRKEKEDEEALLKAKNFVDFMNRDVASIMSDRFKRDEDKINSDWFLKIKQLKAEL